MLKKIKILIVVLIAVIILASLFAANEMDIIDFDDDDDDDENGGNGPVVDENPVAVIEANATHAEVDEEITLNGSGSFDNETNITSYHWDFGDGNTGENMTMNHSWIASGAYNVTLTVEDAEGNFNSTWIYVGITYREHRQGTIGSGSDGFSFDMWEMATAIYINMTIEQNIEDPDRNDITLNIYKGDNVTWTRDHQSGWTETIEEQYFNNTNLSAISWQWEIIINDAGFIGSMDWDVRVVIYYV